MCFYFVFVKQKTAYEMRISDWSSDVCSSDLGGRMTTQRFGKVWFDHVSLLADVPDRWTVIDLATGARRAFAGSDVPSVPSLAPGKAGVDGDRSEERRVGTACVRTCNSRVSTFHS